MAANKWRRLFVQKRENDERKHRVCCIWQSASATSTTNAPSGSIIRNRHLVHSPAHFGRISVHSLPACLRSLSGTTLWADSVSQCPTLAGIRKHTSKVSVFTLIAPDCILFQWSLLGCTLVKSFPNSTSLPPKTANTHSSLYWQRRSSFWIASNESNCFHWKRQLSYCRSMSHHHQLTCSLPTLVTTLEDASLVTWSAKTINYHHHRVNHV